MLPNKLSPVPSATSQEQTTNPKVKWFHCGLFSQLVYKIFWSLCFQFLASFGSILCVRWTVYNQNLSLQLISGSHTGAKVLPSFHQSRNTPQSKFSTLKLLKLQVTATACKEVTHYLHNCISWQVYVYVESKCKLQIINVSKTSMLQLGNICEKYPHSTSEKKYCN